MSNLYRGTPWGPVPTNNDWADIENQLGREMPGDIRALIRRTGGCPMGHCYVRNPAEKKNRNLMFSHGALMQMHDLDGPMLRQRHGICLYPDIGGYVTFANINTVNISLKPAEDSCTVLHLGAGLVYETDLLFTEFIWEIFTDRAAYNGLGASNWLSSSSPFFAEW